MLNDSVTEPSVEAYVGEGIGENPDDEHLL
jgi:hypothetical protein